MQRKESLPPFLKSAMTISTKRGNSRDRVAKGLLKVPNILVICFFIHRCFISHVFPDLTAYSEPLGWVQVRQSGSKEAHALFLKDLQLVEEINTIKESHTQMHGCKYCLMFGKRIQSSKKQQSNG